MTDKHDYKSWVNVPHLKGYVIKKDGTLACVKPRNKNACPPKDPRVLKTRLNHFGYEVVSIRESGKNKTHFIHVLVARTFIGKKPYKYEVNHIDGDKLNNHIDNLEYVTRRENSTHSKKNKSGYTGVYFIRNRYQAQIRHKGKLKVLGYFLCPKKAHDAYLKAVSDLGEENKYARSK